MQHTAAMRMLFRSSCALALLALVGARAHAAVLIALDLGQLVDGSDYVVVAKAEQESSRYEDGLIVTDDVLRVITSYKGDVKPGQTLTVTHLGGAVDRVALRVPGAARFALGQSAIVFLRRTPRGDLNVTGMSQGVLPIVGEGPDAQVTPAAGSGSTLMQRNSQGGMTQAPGALQGPRKLSDVLGQIEQLVGTR